MPTASTDAATAASAPQPLSREPAAAPAAPLANAFATLPALVPAPPAPGQRAKLEPLPESADALALAQIALAARAERRTLAIVCADARAATRVAEELAWYAPALAIGVFPD